MSRLKWSQAYAEVVVSNLRLEQIGAQRRLYTIRNHFKRLPECGI
jgi:hypothetical protein